MATVVHRTERDLVARGERGMEIALPSSATGGAAALVETVVPAKTAGPPRHRHPGSDEVFVVLAGSLLLDTAEGVHRLEAGDVAFVPRGEPHTFATPPDSAARFLGLHTPGGFEAFHGAAARAAAERGRALSREELVAVATDFDWEPAGAPLDPAASPIG